MSSSDHQENTLEGRHHVDTKDLKIQEVATWAVAEYNKEHEKNLKYEKVIRAEQESLPGCTTYYFIVEVIDDDGKIVKYYAVVIEMITATPILELQKFEKLLGNEPTPVEN